MCFVICFYFFSKAYFQFTHFIVLITYCVRVTLRFFSWWILGNFSSIKHPQRSYNFSSDFNLRLFGRFWRLSQNARSHFRSLSRNPTDSWTITNFLQSKRSNVSRFGAHNSGNSLMVPHSRSFICLKILNWIHSRLKKKKKSKFSFGQHSKKF